CEIVGVCDVNKTKVEAAMKRFPGVKGTVTVEEFFKIPEMDAVVIATPDKVHAENAIAAMQAGKHVFLEKPMTQTVEDCDLLIDMASERDKVFMVGLELRYCPLFQDMKKLIED